MDKLHNNIIKAFAGIFISLYSPCEGTLRFTEITSDTFIIRWAFQDICDHIFDPCTNKCAWPTDPQGVTFDPKKVKEADIIFVRDIDYFFEMMVPFITVPFIIVTHGEFRDTTLEYQLNYLDEEKVIAWFSIHPPLRGHSKYVPLPLGIMQEPKNYKDKASFNDFLQNLRKKPKDMLLYMNFDETLNPERHQLKKQFIDEPYCFNRDKAIPFEEYLEEMAHYKFALSPRGWGPDCYRTWEALLVGTIPIVVRNQSGQIVTIKTPLRLGTESTKSVIEKFSAEPQPSASTSQLDTLYENLPILVIDNWEVLSKPFLEKKYREITSKTYDLSKLYINYWYNRIKTVRTDYLNTKKDRAIDFDDAMQFDHHLTPKARALTAERRKDPLVNFCRLLYSKNPYIPNRPLSPIRIPKTVHLIWVGPNKLPESYTACLESIKKFLPGWKCKLWTDADIPNLKLTYQKYYDEETNYGAKADILRYELLYRYGGVFLDIDFEVTQDLSPLHAAYEFYCCLMPSTRISIISNGVIGSIPGHPILKRCLESLANHRTAPFVLERTGPILFQNAFYEVVQRMLDNPIVALPRTFFFPIDATRIAPTRTDIMAQLRAHTFGIHHWAGSWVDETNHEHHKAILKEMHSEKTSISFKS